MTEEREVEPEYALVCENEGGDCIELLTNATDNSLSLQMLTNAFPNAHGLKYKNPATGVYRALAMDTSGTAFIKPFGGWQNKLFVVIASQPQPQLPSSASTSSVANKSHAKRTKWRLKEQWRLNALKWLYTIPPSKDCVVVVDSTTAVTFHHGTHQSYVVDLTSFDVSPVNRSQGENITVMVAKIIPYLDLVVLRATNGVPFPFWPDIERPRPGMNFCVIGFGHADQSNETYCPGVIFTKSPHYYPNERGSYMGPFWLGTARTSCGDSGGACVSSDGYLIGMNVSTTCMPSTCHTKAISDAAIFVSKNALVGAEEIARVLLEKPADRKPESSYNSEQTILHVFQ